MSRPQPYLVRCEAPDEAIASLAAEIDAHQVTDHLVLVLTTLTRSQLYHRTKATQPTGSTLLVAPLAGPPKSMGVAVGTSAWVRSHVAPLRSMQANGGA
jgi:hypothetical protein